MGDVIDGFFHAIHDADVENVVVVFGVKILLAHGLDA